MRGRDGGDEPIEPSGEESGGESHHEPKTVAKKNSFCIDSEQFLSRGTD